MVNEKIKYNSPPNDNGNKVSIFIGEQPPCPICNGYGEYEENGPHTCWPCISRLIQFIDKDGNRVMADWGDEIEKDEMGNLTLIENHLYD